MAFITIEKLEFSEEQKREYKKLKVIVVSIGTIILVLMIILYLMGERDLISILGFFLIAFFAYFNDKYRKLLSKNEKTIGYAKVQKELYSKLYKHILPPVAIGAIIGVWIILKFHLNPYLIVVYCVGSGIIAGVWAGWYEKKKLGSIKRAP